jgi:hypothetical protein
LVKVKVRKREKAPIYVRELGEILHGDKEVCGSMVLVIEAAQVDVWTVKSP